MKFINIFTRNTLYFFSLRIIYNDFKIIVIILNLLILNFKF